MFKFQMPKSTTIKSRTSSITNAFVNGIVPSIVPSEKEVEEALSILEIDKDDLRCAYCGDKFTEWDHFRPLIFKKKPTGYISEIHNLVPACGKCNQSKGNKNWKVWMMSDAKLSPKSRGVKDLEERRKRLEKFEKWKRVESIDFEKIVGIKNWSVHEDNHKKILAMLKKCQEYSDFLKKLISQKYKS